MASNEQILQERADVAASILQTPGGGGILPPEKAAEFFRVLQNTTSLLGAVRMESMKSLTKSIPKINFSNVNVLSVAPDATNTDDLPLLASADRSAPTNSEITLNAKPYMAMVKLGMQTLMTNVAHDDFENVLMDEMLKAVANQIEVQALSSDTALSLGGPRDALNKQDGWLKRISSNVIDNSDAALSSDLLKNLKLAVNRRFRQGAHKFWLEDGAGENWRSILGARATPGGDDWLIKGEIPPAHGVPLVVVPNMPVSPAVGGGSPRPARSTVLYTDPKNLILGMFQNIEVHIEIVYREGSLYITVMWQNAFAVMHEAAAAKATNVIANPASLS